MSSRSWEVELSAGTVSVTSGGTTVDPTSSVVLGEGEVITLLGLNDTRITEVRVTPSAAGESIHTIGSGQTEVVTSGGDNMVIVTWNLASAAGADILFQAASLTDVNKSGSELDYKLGISVRLASDSSQTGTWDPTVKEKPGG